jgi:hypothetical protein
LATAPIRVDAQGPVLVMMAPGGDELR